MKVRSFKTKLGDAVFVLIGIIVIIICLVPMLNLAAKSLSATDALVKNEVYLWPVGWNFDAYAMVFSDMKYIRSFFFTVILTFVCTILSLVMTTLCAYPLIFENLKGRGFINILITITMFFNAGTIPNYLLMKSLGMLNTVWVLMIPSCLSIFNMIIMPLLHKIMLLVKHG
mgnify:CR=1 FL=1